MDPRQKFPDTYDSLTGKTLEYYDRTASKSKYINTT